MIPIVSAKPFSFKNHPCGMMRKPQQVIILFTVKLFLVPFLDGKGINKQATEYTSNKVWRPFPLVYDKYTKNNKITCHAVSCGLVGMKQLMAIQ